MDGEYQFDVSKIIDHPPDKTPVVLLSCGSFNPITFSHLRILEMAKEHANKYGEFVIGGYISPVSDAYKKQGLISAKYRVEMCRLAVKESDWIMLDEWEARSTSYVRTLCVLNHIRDQVKEKLNIDDVKVKLVCGSDLLESFNIPGVWKDEDILAIVKDYGIICIERTTSDPEIIIKKNPILSEYKDNIWVYRVWLLDHINSTSIRQAIKNGFSIMYLTPNSVVKYIKDNNLYTD